MLARMLFRLMALLALVAGITWLLRRILPAGGGRPFLRRGYEFRIEFREGRRRRVDGVVPRSVYNAFEDVAALSRVSGRVSALPDGALDFSDGITEGARQQFRNAWWAGRNA